MRQNQYTFDRSRIFGQTFIIWLSIMSQVALNVFIISQMPPKSWFDTLLYTNCVLGCINFPSVYIFINYLKYSTEKQLTITADTIQLLDKDPNQLVKIKLDEITQLETVTTPQGWKLPWLDFEYACFRDVHNKKIITTSFIITNKKLLQLPQIIRIKNKTLIHRKEIYPFIH